MLTVLVVFLRSLALRPLLRHRDRLFWILLAEAWRDWRTAKQGALQFLRG